MEHPPGEQGERQRKAADHQERLVQGLILGGATRIGEQPAQIEQGDQGAGQTAPPTAEGGRVHDRDEQEQRGGGYGVGGGGEGRDDAGEDDGQRRAGANRVATDGGKLGLGCVWDHGGA